MRQGISRRRLFAGAAAPAAAPLVCESDFVVIPSGILLNSIAGVPVFLNDPN